MFNQKSIKLAFFCLSIFATMGVARPSLAMTGVESVAGRSIEEIPSSIKRQNHPRLLHNSFQEERIKVVLAAKPAPMSEQKDTKKAKFMRFISWYYFFLFFVPLCIFYPLFLFYRKLLVDLNETNDSLPDIYESASQDDNSLNLDLKIEQDSYKATVSKLQIAFLPPASFLRKGLEQVASSADSCNRDRDLIDMMRETIAVLILEDNWTHASHTSVSLPLDKVRTEFDLICDRERIKFKRQEFSSISREKRSSDRPNRQDNYVVVTLILCTTHDTPLFHKILTQKQLVEQLRKFGKMSQECLIEFELLWNPQEEGYVSNERLLIEYGDMIRLL